MEQYIYNIDFNIEEMEKTMMFFAQGTVRVSTFALKSLIIELYLHIKIYLKYFTERLKYAKLEKSTRLRFWVPGLKVVEVLPWYLYSLILDRLIYKIISGFMIKLNTSPVISEYVRKNLY